MKIRGWFCGKLAETFAEKVKRASRTLASHPTPGQPSPGLLNRENKTSAEPLKWHRRASQTLKSATQLPRYLSPKMLNETIEPQLCSGLLRRRSPLGLSHFSGAIKSSIGSPQKTFALHRNRRPFGHRSQADRHGQRSASVSIGWRDTHTRIRSAVIAKAEA